MRPASFALVLSLAATGVVKADYFPDPQPTGWIATFYGTIVKRYPGGGGWELRDMAQADELGAFLKGTSDDPNNIMGKHVFDGSANLYMIQVSGDPNIHEGQPLEFVLWDIEEGRELIAGAEDPNDEPIIWVLNVTQMDLVTTPTYALTLDITNPSWGDVTVEPNDPNFPPFTYLALTEVTLTAEPNQGKSFKKWKLFDPNDANYFVIDTNNPITIDMVADRQVKAFFKCGGGGIGAMLPIMLGMLGLYLLTRRNRPARSSRSLRE